MRPGKNTKHNNCYLSTYIKFFRWWMPRPWYTLVDFLNSVLRPMTDWWGEDLKDPCAGVKPLMNIPYLWGPFCIDGYMAERIMIFCKWQRSVCSLLHNWCSILQGNLDLLKRTYFPVCAHTKPCRKVIVTFPSPDWLSLDLMSDLVI